MKIKQIDPIRPVFSSEEHDNERLIAAIIQYKAYAPNIDVLGVNSYYEKNISQLNSIFESFYPGKPYMVTEFGPKGYWNSELGDYQNNSLLIELSSQVKAEWYQKQWDEYIAKYRGKNLGGMAFSWMDRFEGSATWFGITDYLGRLKPSYYYLQSAWTQNLSVKKSFPDITIVGHWDPIKPGEGQWFSAAILNDYSGPLKYNWVVFDQNWKESNKILNTLNEGQFVEVKVPDNPSRVYVYAEDSLGNVITASRPFVISDK